MKTLSLGGLLNLFALSIVFAQSPTLPLDAICNANGGKFGIVGVPSSVNDGGNAYIYEKQTNQWTLVQNLSFTDVGLSSFYVLLDSIQNSDYSVRYRGFGQTTNITDDFAIVAFNRTSNLFDFPFQSDSSQTLSAIFKRNGSSWDFQEVIPGGDQIEIRGNQVYVTENFTDLRTENDIFLQFFFVENRLWTFPLSPNVGSNRQLIDGSDYSSFSDEGGLPGPLTPDLSVSQDGNVIAWSLLGELEDIFGFVLESDVFRIYRQTNPGTFTKEASFLPPPPVPSSFNAFRAAYNEGNRIILIDNSNNTLIYEKQGTSWIQVQGNPVPGSVPVVSMDDSRAFFPRITWTDNLDEDYIEVVRTLIDENNNVLSDGVIATLCPNVTEFVDTLEAFGKTAFYVIEHVYEQVNTATSSNGVTYSMPARLRRLQLSYSCYEPQGDSLVWSVFNPNAQAHPFIFAQWWSNQRDTLWAPGQSTVLFKTKNNPQSPATFGDDNITGIWWIDQTLAAGTPFDLVQNGINLGNVCPPARRSALWAEQAGNVFSGQLSPYISINKTAPNSDPSLAENITMGPNPVDDVLTIEGLIEDAELSIEIYNQVGQVVKRLEAKGSSNFKLALDELEAGVYLLKIHSSADSFTQKILKK